MTFLGPMHASTVGDDTETRKGASNKIIIASSSSSSFIVTYYRPTASLSNNFLSVQKYWVGQSYRVALYLQLAFFGLRSTRSLPTMLSPVNAPIFAAIVLLVSTADAFTVTQSSYSAHRFDTSLASLTVPGMWGAGLNFGKGDFAFYRSFDRFMKPFSDADRQDFPEIFNMPKGIYEVSMTKPLGIVFEEIKIGEGVFVQDLVEGGLAETQGKVQVGDILVGVTAIKVVGAKFERRLIPARKFDFDTAVGAIGSNEPKWQCSDVVLMFERPGESDPAEVDKFLEFFQPPWDSPWRQQQ